MEANKPASSIREISRSPFSLSFPRTPCSLSGWPLAKDEPDGHQAKHSLQSLSYAGTCSSCSTCSTPPNTEHPPPPQPSWVTERAAGRLLPKQAPTILLSQSRCLSWPLFQYPPSSSASSSSSGLYCRAVTVVNELGQRWCSGKATPKDS